MRSILTDNAVRAAQPGSTLWDGSLKHFGVRVAPGGTKSFVVLLGSGRRQAIGRYPAIKLADARAKARRILAERTLGRHQNTSIAWQTAVEKFLDARRAADIKDHTVRQYQRTLELYFRFGSTKLSEITKGDISVKLEKLNRVPSQKAHALVVIKMVFRWALHEGYVETDTAASFKRPKQNKRTRVLSDAELKAVWEACGIETKELPKQFSTIVKLLILMGQRRSETAALRSSWVAADKITLPAEITKNARVHSFPLGRRTADLVTSVKPNEQGLLFSARGRPNRPFNGWSTSKAALDRLSGVSGWTLHDLRRTYRTIHARIGTPPHVAERLINHANGIASEVEQIYDRYHYMPEMAKAVRDYEVALWAIFAPELADPRADTVRTDTT
jgi:integrase